MDILHTWLFLYLVLGSAAVVTVSFGDPSPWRLSCWLGRNKEGGQPRGLGQGDGSPYRTPGGIRRPRDIKDEPPEVPPGAESGVLLSPSRVRAALCIHHHRNHLKTNRNCQFRGARRGQEKGPPVYTRGSAWTCM